MLLQASLVFRVLAPLTLFVASSGLTPPPAHSPVLQKKLENYDPTTRDLYDWVNSAGGPDLVPSTANAWPRVCKGNAGCKAKNRKAQIDAGPEAEAIKLNISTTAGIPANGQVVAWMEQKGAYTEAAYGVPRGKTGKVLIIVERGTGSVIAKWSAVYVDVDGFEVLSEGKYTKCQFPHNDGNSRAGFGGCPASLAAAQKIHSSAQAVDAAKTKTARDAAIAAFRRLFTNFEEDPLWVSCVGGCCIVEQ